MKSTLHIEQDAATDGDNARETSGTFALYNCGEASAIICLNWFLELTGSS